jgi:hypothetical protein
MPQSSCLVITDHATPAQCEEILVAQLNPLGVELSPEALTPEIIYIAMTLAQDQWEVLSE